MAKIPTILEAGRADGKLATTNSIFDENKSMFQSEINDIQDTLNSDNPNKPLSAKQGKILKELLDAKVIEAGSVPIDLEPTEGNTTHVVSSDGLAKEFNKCNTVIITTDRIEDGAVTTEKIASSAFDDVPIARSNNLIKSSGVFNLPVFATKNVKDFNKAIQELYVNPEYVSNTDFLSFRCVNTLQYFICSAKGGTDRRFICANNGHNQNKVIYPLIVTTSNDVTVPVGTIIGYVLFRDVDYFITNSSTNNEYNVNNRVVTCAQYSPLIFSGMVDKITENNIADEAIISSKLADGAIISSKLADKSVLPNKVNFEIVRGQTSFDYTNSLLELYIIAPIPKECEYYFKLYNNKLWLDYLLSNGTGGISGHWRATTNSLITAKNYTPYQIICTQSNEDLGVSVGDIVGYVVFKDLNKIINYNDITFGSFVYKEWVTNPQNSPNIIQSLYLYKEIPENSVSTNTIQDYAVTLEKLQDKFIKSIVEYDIRNTISELYLKTDSVIFDDANGYSKISIRVYGSTLYIRSINDTTLYGWTSTLVLTNCENNVPYELKVSTAGVNNNYAVGDTIGCIIFKDIETLKTKIIGSNVDNGIRDNVINPNLSPVAYQYLANKHINISGVLKYSELQIPTDLYVVVNNRLMLFYRSIVKSYNPDIYGLRVVCNVGKAYPKYYIFDATNIGNYSISFNVVDKDDNIISTKTSTIHVISAMSAPSSNKNILLFGASSMASGDVTGELKRRLTESSGNGTTQNPTGLGLNNITFVGRKKGGSVNVNQEATGGWSWKDYSTEGQLAYRFNVTDVNQLNINDEYTCNGVTLTIMEINITDGSGNIRCIYSGTSVLPTSGTLTRSSGNGDSTITYTSYESESYNPFWNPNKTGGAGLDFTNYANKYCNGSIDVMIACCGYNDFNRYTPATISNLFTDYVKPFIRSYHAEFPNGKFIISTHHLPTPDGGMAANYGAASNWNWLTTAHKIWAFAVEAEKLVKESEFSSYVYLSEVTSEFDCEHSYPTAQAYVNNRSSIKETVTTNGVHFTTVGAYQVSDSLYHTFNRLDL